MIFGDDVRDPLWFSTHLTDCLYLVSFRRYRPLNLSLSCEVVQKGSFGAQFVGERDAQDLGYAFLNELTSEHVTNFR